MKKQEILSVLREKLTDVIDEIPNKYESRDDFSTEEIETESRDGFIPFTDGGTIVRWFERLDLWRSTGHNLPTKPLQDELERQINIQYDYAKERFMELHPEIVKKLGDEKINYSDLYESGFEDEADELSQLETDNDDTIMVSIRAQYYAPSNEQGRDGKHTIALSGDVNLESPYHRDGNLDDFIEVVFTFDSLSELSERMDAELVRIIDWFNGANFEGSIREMKIRRM